MFFFFKQKTAYEMRISDWSSDVCSSDLGHRLGTMEIESALVANPLVAEAAVVGKPHEIKGEAVVAFVVLKNAVTETEAEQIAEELRDWVEIGRASCRERVCQYG